MSNPFRLLDLAEDCKEDLAIDLDSDHDKMIIVFDADIYERNSSKYYDLLKIAEKNNVIVAVTNPAFELYFCFIFQIRLNLVLRQMQRLFLRIIKKGNTGTFIVYYVPKLI